MNILKKSNWLKVYLVGAIMIAIKPMIENSEFLINLLLTWE